MYVHRFSRSDQTTAAAAASRGSSSATEKERRLPPEPGCLGVTGTAPGYGGLRWVVGDGPGAARGLPPWSSVSTSL